MKTSIQIISDGRIEVETAYSQKDLFRITGFIHDPVTRRRWRVIGTRKDGWEHVSVSSPSKTPDWDTMCLAKDVFFGKDECCVQFHPKEEDYVNMHEHTLHIWKKIGEEYETPPSIMVGIKGVTSAQAGAISKAFVDSMSKEELVQAAQNQGIKLNRSIRRKLK